jgi:Na+/melibiose symporter-like transporter
LALLKKIDFVGAILLLAASFLLVTGLLEASTEFHWSSAVIITLIVLSAILWVSFILWEWLLGKRRSKQEEMFPWRFVKNRPWMAMLL